MQKAKPLTKRLDILDIFSSDDVFVYTTIRASTPEGVAVVHKHHFFPSEIIGQIIFLRLKCSHYVVFVRVN